MYEELIHKLRCESCVPYVTMKTMQEAADAIEELSATVAGYEATTDVEFVKEDGHYRSRFVQKWIPVTERLPDCKCHVLVTDGKFVGEAAFFPEAIWHSNYFPPTFSDPVEEYEDYRGVTHWMPLPSTEGLNEA